VSRLSRDRVIISLEPHRVAWVRLSGVLKPRAVACGAVDADAAHGAEPWAGAIAALRVQIEARQRERLAVTIVLSNHFVRYALVEPPPRGVSPEEELALARFHYTRLHGERANAWDVKVAPAKRGSPRVASAIDRALLAALQSVFAKPSRARLVSVQPYLMCAFNRWRGRIETRGAWLVLAEAGRVCVGLMAADNWRALQSVRSGGDAHDWLALVEREALRTAAKPVPTTVLARSPGGVDSDVSAHGPWHVVALQPPVVAGIPDAEREVYAMALHAA
jgi:hypothetical protein